MFSVANYITLIIKTDEIPPPQPSAAWGSTLIVDIHHAVIQLHVHDMGVATHS